MVARLTRIIPLLLLLAFVAGVVYVVAAWRYSPARAKEILIKAFTVLNVALTVGGAGDHADMPRRVSEAQPLVSDEADESEAFAPLALGKKIDREGARNRAPFLWRGKALGKRF